ncbi:hypothetical protein AB0387_25990 [Streptomyces sp. NPDC089173]|uniref:DUF6907 domain-containing protein n=1 Tax=Streptomyces sp. NPDC089173 TaxID=3154965 RepID=UPI00344F4F25
MSMVAPASTSVPSPASAPVLSAPVPPQPPAPSAPVVSHPTACPSWCKDRNFPAGHNSSPRDTAHRSRALELKLSGETDTVTLVRAELFRLDELDDIGETVLYVQGEEEQGSSSLDVEMFVASLVAFTDNVRVLHRQMG